MTLHIHVVGAGVAGLATAVTLTERGVAVTVHERSIALGANAASWLAGGMLAPFCEAERGYPGIVAPGLAGIAWWAARVPGVERRGTLVVAPARDAAEVQRFERRATGGRPLSMAEIGDVEPDLAGRFGRGLLFAEEAHLDPRKAMDALAARFVSLGGDLRLGSKVEPSTLVHGRPPSPGPSVSAVVDCRGSSSTVAGLRGVRGEMLILFASDVHLSRPVRLLHSRHPVYVVPRGDGRFMVGATEIESASSGDITARSVMELLNAAYALHPGFAEAEIVETGAALRPAFPDNLPCVSANGRIVSFNGLYRHGFLLSPAFAEKAADLAMDVSKAGRQAA